MKLPASTNIYLPAIALALLLAAGIIYVAFFQPQKEQLTETGYNTNTTQQTYPQALLIESKGLAEFNAENNTVNSVSPQDKKLAEEMVPIFKEMGDGKDVEKTKQAVIMLGRIIENYPEYSDTYLLRASTSVLVGDKDYQKILSDIDNAIKFHSSVKYKSAYDSTAEMYGLRAKVDMLSTDYPQTLSDLEAAIKADPNNTNGVFNTGGVKPEDASSTTALQKQDFDLLIAQYPNDYRGYMLRGLFYNSFTVFDKKYCTPASDDLQHAASLNPSSALAYYLLGREQSCDFLSTVGKASDSYRSQLYQRAIPYFSEAIKFDPQFTDAYAQMAESLYSLERYTEAIPYYDKVVELNPSNAGAYNDRGLAKTYAGDHYGAISDFSQAIDLKNQKPDSFLDSSYKNRADAYVKVNDYDSAIGDYSRAIGLNFGRVTLSMPISQIRAMYPELNDIPDQSLVEGLWQKYYPNLTPEDFAKSLLSKNVYYPGSTILADLYVSRGDTLLKMGKFKKATIEYTRSLKENHGYADILASERWKLISQTPDAEDSLDIQTLDFTHGNIVSLWLKSVNTNSKIYSQQNYQIDCSGRMIKSLSSTSYGANGNPLHTTQEQEWQSVGPETIGEVLYNGMCGK